MRRGVWRQYLCDRTDYFEKYEGYLSSNDGPRADPEKLRGLALNLKKSI
ncbi:MAG: hypothetical protein ACLFN8_03860 [Candidatus Woesearchaeota archaeon]